MKKMRLNLFANKSKVKVLKKRLKKIEGKTVARRKTFTCIAIENKSEKEKTNMKKK